jgi:hypothetical protein
VLALPNFAIPFTIETDALGNGIGVALMQQSQPLAFYSQALGPKAAAAVFGMSHSQIFS